MAEGGGGQGYQFVCSLKELERLGRKRVTVEERVVVLFHVKGQVYAMDHFCYRKWLKQNMQILLDFYAS
jgi:nitrite reductase/ring-hydroxylating ferredoxin subunit